MRDLYTRIILTIIAILLAAQLYVSIVFLWVPGAAPTPIRSIPIRVDLLDEEGKRRPLPVNVWGDVSVVGSYGRAVEVEGRVTVNEIESVVDVDIQ